MGVRVSLTFSAAGPQVAHPAAHRHEAAEVSRQALVRLLVQPGEGAEAVPVHISLLLLCSTGLLFDLLHAKRGHHSVEVTLLAPGPPAEVHKGLSQITDKT